MPLSPDEFAKFEAAAAEALNAFKLLQETLTPEERKGFDKLLGWYRTHSMKCGHKRTHEILHGRRG